LSAFFSEPKRKMVVAGSGNIGRRTWYCCVISGHTAIFETGGAAAPSGNPVRPRLLQAAHLVTVTQCTMVPV